MSDDDKKRREYEAKYEKKKHDKKFVLDKIKELTEKKWGDVKVDLKEVIEENLKKDFGRKRRVLNIVKEKQGLHWRAYAKKWGKSIVLQELLGFNDDYNHTNKKYTERKLGEDQFQHKKKEWLERETKIEHENAKDLLNKIRVAMIVSFVLDPEVAEKKITFLSVLARIVQMSRAEFGKWMVASWPKVVNYEGTIDTYGKIPISLQSFYGINDVVTMKALWGVDEASLEWSQQLVKALRWYHGKDYAAWYCGMKTVPTTEEEKDTLVHNLIMHLSKENVHYVWTVFLNLYDIYIKSERKEFPDFPPCKDCERAPIEDKLRSKIQDYFRAGWALRIADSQSICCLRYKDLLSEYRRIKKLSLVYTPNGYENRLEI